LFGLNESQVTETLERGYQPGAYYESDPMLRQALDALVSGQYSGGDTSAFANVADALLTSDPFLVLADFGSYVAAQESVDRAYQNQDAWTRSAVLNVARSGFFSSDRSIKDYLDRIWHAPAVPMR
jgi:starch phosphorylase